LIAYDKVALRPETLSESPDLTPDSIFTFTKVHEPDIFKEKVGIYPVSTGITLCG